ncbi:hypothetical protein [Streptomyces caelestis]|uniref:hypothetical protein n=1 Tax=Streptomyces caelestis TaxID=36816 RepID=UPI0036FAF248
MGQQRRGGPATRNSSVRHASRTPRGPRHIGRRRFLTTTGGAAAALAFATSLPSPGVAAAAEPGAVRITENRSRWASPPVMLKPV